MPKMTCEKIPKVSTRYFRPRMRGSILTDQRLASFTLTSTPCYFGGQRYWFICTADKDGEPCGKRAGVLYLINDIFACRRCHDLAYESQQRNHVGRRAFCRKYREGEKNMERSFMEMRIKQWRGNPTKRYQKWLMLSERRTRDASRFLLAEMLVIGFIKSRRKSR